MRHLAIQRTAPRSSTPTAVLSTTSAAARPAATTHATLHPRRWERIVRFRLRGVLGRLWPLGTPPLRCGGHRWSLRRGEVRQQRRWRWRVCWWFWCRRLRRVARWPCLRWHGILRSQCSALRAVRVRRSLQLRVGDAWGGGGSRSGPDSVSVTHRYSPYTSCAVAYTVVAESRLLLCTVHSVDIIHISEFCGFPGASCLCEPVRTTSRSRVGPDRARSGLAWKLA